MARKNYCLAVGRPECCFRQKGLLCFSHYVQTVWPTRRLPLTLSSNVNLTQLHLTVYCWHYVECMAFASTPPYTHVVLRSNFTLTLPDPGLAALDFSVMADPVPDGGPVAESLGSLTTSTTEWNLYRECLMSSSGMSSGISNTNTVKVFCGRQGIGTWNKSARLTMCIKSFVPFGTWKLRLEYSSYCTQVTVTVG